MGSFIYPGPSLNSSKDRVKSDKRDELKPSQEHISTYLIM